MATVHSTARRRSDRNRSRSSNVGTRTKIRKAHSRPQSKSAKAGSLGPGIRIAGRLRTFLESEQGFLLKTQSLLLCIAQSMEDSGHPSTGPYYPDVVELAAELVGRRAVNLDEMLLEGRVLGTRDMRPIL